MEPIKALTFIAAAGAISLVGAGAFGFYVGYRAGHSMGDTPVIVAGSGNSGAVSLRPVLDNIQSLSKQVEALAAAKAQPISVATTEAQPVNLKPVLDEIRSLGRQVELMKTQTAPTVQTLDAGKVKIIDYSEDFENLRERITALSTKIDKQEPRAPKALVEEIRSLSASIQAQEPSARRAVTEEIRNAVATLQSAEPRAPRAVIEEIRSLGTALASLKSQDNRPQTSVIDQMKVLNATLESLKERIAEGGASSGGGGSSDGAVAAHVAELRTLMATATEQFNKCQVQLASMPASAAGQRQPGPGNNSFAGATTIAVSQTPQTDGASVVFFDNVTLRKDQEKQYDEIGVKISLQQITPRQVKLAVNRQGVGLAFGERKMFRSQDVECELNLMETNLNDSQARISLSCKR